jgi:acyl carrier protein
VLTVSIHDRLGETTVTEASDQQKVLDQITDFIVMNFLFGDQSRMPASGDSLLESGLVDSTGVLEIVDFLEADLGIVVADDETVPANLDSIDNLTAYVLRKRTAVEVS